MGQKEHPLVWYYDQNPRFAGLINGWLFCGQDKLQPGDLSDADRRSLSRRGRKIYQDRYRDLYKRVDHMAFRLLIGVEEQGYIHYAMPVRVMDYDSASYTAQKARISSRHQEQADLKDDAFLSGFSKEDRLLPVITLILYCGSKPWDGALRLHDLLNLEPLPETLQKYVADYPIHVLDVCHTPDQRLHDFPPDIRTMFLFFKYREDPGALMRKLADADDISLDTYDTIADFAGEQRLKRFRPNVKGEKICMCRAIDILIQDGEQRGEKTGEKRGEKRGFQLGVDAEKKNTERERQRAEKAEARIRELEQMLNL